MFPIVFVSATELCPPLMEEHTSESIQDPEEQWGMVVKKSRKQLLKITTRLKRRWKAFAQSSYGEHRIVEWVEVSQWKNRMMLGCLESQKGKKT